MGALTQPLDIKEIEAQLTKSDRIAVISCNTCVRFCGTGGINRLDQVAERLREDGFSVSDTVLLTAACVRDYTERSRLSSGITKVVALTCDGGWTSLQQALPNVEVIKANETLGIMIVSPSKGVVKLAKSYEKHRPRLGEEFALLTGKPKTDRQIDMEAGT
jgi:hypothetical protein